MTKCLSRLTSISNEAWKMAEQADKEGDMEAKAAALSLAQKAALDILKVVTDNHWLVDEAFKFRNKQESESLNDKKERIQPIV